MSNRFKLKTLSIAITSLLVANTALAYQDQESTSTSQEKSPDTIEVIEVTGFLGSLTRALNTKRFSNNVVDAIAAEDIGKSTDQNIAEALQRVTGVAIGRGDGGEGTTISIRGAGPDLNNVSLNGVTLTSSGTNQGVDFSQFSADVLAGIEVIKTSSADHDEGSLGATVRLKGFKPLDAKHNKRTATVELRHNSFADVDGSPDHKFSFALSEKFLDETLGVSVVASTEDQTRRSDRYENTGFRTLTFKDATDVTTGELIGDSVTGHANRQNRYSFEYITRDRESISTTLQWRPSDDTDIQFDHTFTQQEAGRDASFFSNTSPNKANEPENIIFDPDTNTFLQLVNTSTTSKEAFAIRSHRDEAQTTEKNNIAGLQITHAIDDITLSLRAGYAKSSSEDDFYYKSRFGAPKSLRGTGVFHGFDCTGDSEICRQVLTEGFADNPENYIFDRLDLRDRGIEDLSKSLYFDVDWDVEWGPITQIETGLKWNKRTKDNKETSQQFKPAKDFDGDILSERNLADFGEFTFSPSDWGEELGFPRDHITDGWALPNGRAIFDVLNTEEQTPNVDFNPGNNRNIAQEFTAIYLKANFEFFDGRLTGDVGARYTNTDVVASGFSGITFLTRNFISASNIEFFNNSEAETIEALGVNTLQRNAYPTTVNDENDYSNFLPSLNLNYALDEDKIARFAVSKTIARPKIDDLKPGFTIGESEFEAFSRAKLGATQLAPFESINVDLSYEWYFNAESLFAVTLFNKEFSNFTERSQYLAYWKDVRGEYYGSDGNLLPEDQVNFSANVSDIIIPFSTVDNIPANCMPNRELDLATAIGDETCDVLNVDSLRNGDGGYIRGLEVTMQHSFSYLPGAWSGLGVVTNYTYSDSQQDEQIVFNPDGSIAQTVPETAFEGTSKHTFNTTLFWEKDGKGVRLAYNTRSDYLLSRAEKDGFASWIEGFDTLDFSANWDVNKTVSFGFQATNLTDTVTRRYGSYALDTGALPLENIGLGDAPSFRTIRAQNNGTTYRLSMRVNF